MRPILVAGRSSDASQTRRRVAVAAVASVLVAGACSCSDGSSGDTAAAQTTTPAPPGATTAASPATTSTPTTTQNTAPVTDPTTTSTSAPPDTTAPSLTATVDEEALQAILDQWRADVDTYGATLSIRIPGHDDIHLASGIDDRTINTTGPGGTPTEHSETPMRTDGTYPLSAVTRTFIAAIALQLVDEGRLSLDEPVAKWLPELPNADKITLAMLLDNTSGFGDFDIVPTMYEDLARSFTPEEALAEQLGTPPIGPPGESYAFAAAGYIAAGLLIERVLDQDLADIITERITQPLALNDTFLGDGSIKPTRHGWFSPPADPNPNRPLDILDAPLQALMTIAWADGGGISSSQDLLDWTEALFSGEFLGEETTATMLEMRNLDPGLGTYYGLGVQGYCLHDDVCGPDRVVDVVGHSGNLIYGVLVAYDPESGTSVVVYENSAVVPTWATTPPLLADLFHQLGIK